MLQLPDSPTLLLWGHGRGEADHALNARLIAIRDVARRRPAGPDLRAMARDFARAADLRGLPGAVITHSLRFALLVADTIDDPGIDALVDVARAELRDGDAAAPAPWTRTAGSASPAGPAGPADLRPESGA